MKCQGCMAEIPLGTTACPYCGFVQGTPPNNSQYLKPGTKIAGVYLVGKVLGAGGFGVTYIGWDERLNRKIAIKEYFPTGLATRIPGQSTISTYSGEHGEIFRHGLTRFREEAQILMKFAGQEGIVSVFDLIETNGTAYMVMEFVEGITLEQNIGQFGKLSEQNVLDCIIPMLLSLKFVHGEGYIHRDIAPDNIICLPDGTVKLLDFGAARYAVAERTQSLSAVAKAGFSPFEQYQRHGNQGSWTDLYAVGATMYMALTGVRPEGAMDRLTNDTLKRPSECGADVSENVENAIMAALSVQAKDRPQDIDTFIAMLYGEIKTVTDGGHTSKYLIPLIAGLSAAVIALGTGVGILLARPDTVSVPGVVGEPRSEAETILNDAELGMVIRGGTIFDAEEVAKATDEGVIPADTVMVQDPVSGTSVEKKTMVGVALSKGKEQVFLTDARYMTEKAAIEELHSEGAEHISTQSAPSDEPEGTVIDQSIDPHNSCDYDTEIILTISAGSDRAVSDAVVKVGNYIGMDFYDVKEALSKNDVYLVKTASVYSDTAPVDAIIDQEPAEGSEIKGGGVVYVVVSRGKEKARVPDVRYLTLEEAKQALMERGLSWRIEYVDEPSVEEGRIAAQEIGGIDCSSATRTSFGTKVTLKVSGTGEAETSETAEPTPIPIAILSSTDTLEVGAELEVSCLYDGGQPIVWSTSNHNLAEVSENGSKAVVKAKAFGTVSVTASAGSDTCKLTIYIRDEKRITKIDDYELEVGDTQALNAAVPEAIRDQVTWYSSNPNAAKVEKGLVTALAPGYTTISACYKDQTAKCGVAVSPKYIRVLKSLLTTLDGAKQVLTEKNVKFSVQEEYSDKYKEGIFIEQYTGYDDNDSYHFLDGTEVILYHSLGKNEVTDVKISRNPKKMEYTYKDKMDFSGLTMKLTYKDGTIKEQELNLKDSVTLTQMPKQKITFKWMDRSFELNVTVKPIEVESVALDRAPLKITVGLTYDKMGDKLTVLPEDANDKTVTWSSSNPAVLSVDPKTGKLTALKSGEAKVIATANNGKKGERSVTVVDVVPSEITLNRSELTFELGGAAQTLTATVKPDNAANKTVTWASSDSSVATVDKNGKVTPGKVGKAVITAKTFNDFKATCSVTVAEIVPKAITISDESELWLKKGVKMTLSAYVTPENAGNRTVSWSSDNPSAAAVDAKTGEVTTIATGTARITAMTANGLTDVCTIHVSNPATGISLDRPEIAMKKGETVTLHCTLTPADADASRITWSSGNGGVVWVDGGTVTAVGSGSTTIYASTENGLSAGCAVYVSNPATGIKLDRSEVSLKPGESVTLVCSPVPADADMPKITWSSGSSGVASVYGGTVTAGKSGSTTITATSDSGFTASCSVRVKSDAALSLTSLPRTDYYIGDSIDYSDLVLAYTDEYGAVKNVYFRDVDLTAKGSTDKEGTSTVTISYKGLSKSYDITVKTPSIRLDGIERLDGNRAIDVYTTPANVKDIAFISSNPDVIDVQKTGSGYVAMAHGAGDADIYAIMKYNGYTYYSNTLSLYSKDETKYDGISIALLDSGDNSFWFGIKSDVPGASTMTVDWSVSGDAWGDLDVLYVVEASGSFTVYASYTYSGKTYKDSYTVEVQKKPQYKETKETITEYHFYIEGDDGGGRGFFTAVSDFPGFDPYQVSWSVSSQYGVGGSSDGKGGYWVDSYPILEAGGGVYTVYATYSFDGTVVTSQCEVTVTVTYHELD